MIGSGLTALTADSSTAWIVNLYATRFIAGTGIGGEYAAINSAIDELVGTGDNPPAVHRLPRRRGGDGRR